MTPRQQVSRAAVDLIKRFEGYRRRAARLPDGRWTIGYGHTLTAREGAEVSEDDAEALLLYDLIGLAITVGEMTYAPLTQNQFDALCAFAFSIGVDAFRGSDVLKRVNAGAFTEAAFALELWRKAEFEGERIVIDALVRRRAAEKLLFLTPPGDAWRAAPSALLKPQLDTDAADTSPREPPVAVIASLEGEAAVVARDLQAVDDPRSPVTIAAEAVAARLETLFTEPSPPAPAEAPEPEPAPSDLQGEPAAAAEPAVALAPAAEPAAQAALPPEESLPRVVIDDIAPFEFIAPSVIPLERRDGDGVLAIVALTLVGLAFFAGGVFWALSAHPELDPGPFTPLLVGWLAGVAGVGFLSVAVFLLLQRLGDAADRRDRRRS